MLGTLLRNRTPRILTGTDVNRNGSRASSGWKAVLQSSSRKVKHRTSLWSNNFTLRYRLNKNLYLYKGFYTNTSMSIQMLLQSVYRSMTHDSQKEEITQVFVNKSMSWQNVANPYNERLFSHLKKKKNEVLIQTTTWKHAQWKKPGTNDYIWYDSIHIKFTKKADPKRKKSSLMVAKV